MVTDTSIMAWALRRTSALDFSSGLERRGRTLLGPGRPSLLWVRRYGRVVPPRRRIESLDRTIGTLVISPQIGLILTKCPQEMVAYILAQPAISQQRWREKLWLGFSAERQPEFDERWPPMRALAERGWVTFVSIAPMLGPVTLPPDFLALARWVIVGGEQGRQTHIRDMKPSWARAVRDQCTAADIAFFMKQMSGKRPLPPDLLIRQFPRR